MKFSLSRALIIARREYLTTVRRGAFVFTLVLTPAILFFSTYLSQKLAGDDFKAHFRQARIVAVVDSSGQYANAPLECAYRPPVEVPVPTLSRPHPTASEPVTVAVVMRPFASQQVALDSLDAGTVNAVLVIAADFVATGHVRRYERDTRALTSSGDDRPLRWWLSRGLLRDAVDSVRAQRVWSLANTVPLYTPAKTGGYQLKDDAREMAGFFLPFIMGFLIAMSVMTGGQYLIQGVVEEKETRILESLLCTVTPGDLMVGKMLGLGGAGLTLIGVWVTAGLMMGGGLLAALNLSLPPALLVLAVVYFVLAYLFFGSIMTGVGAVVNNLREAQQLTMIFSLANFFPFYVLVKLINAPNSGLAVGMSLFPPTAATTMLMRLTAASASGATIPPAQVAGSLALLAATTVLTLMASAKIFRIGMLLYGKTPNLPEILKLLRQK